MEPAVPVQYYVVLRSAPLVLPSLCLVLAIVAGQATQYIEVPLAGGLLGLGIALGRRTGFCIAAAGLGLLAVWGQPEIRPQLPPAIDSNRPVQVNGRLLGSWEEGDFGWQSTLAVESLRQGIRVVRWRTSLRLLVGSRDRPEEGSRASALGYLRRAPGLANSPSTDPGNWGLTVKSARHLEIDGHPGTVRRGLGVLRGRLEEALILVKGDRSREVLQALLLGRGNQLARHDRQNLRRLGLAHLFAVSGLHVALLGGGVYLLCSPMPRGVRVIASLLAIGMYAGLTGARPSILRAGLMALVAALSLYLGRPAVALQALATAIAVMVLTSPLLVLDVGFQLTVAATSGLVWLSPLLSERLSNALPLPIKRSLAASVAAQLGCGPWTWSRFAIVPPAAPLLNLMAVPWMSVLLASSLVWGAIAVVSPEVAGTLSPGIGFAAAPLSVLKRIPPSALVTWPVSVTFFQALLAALLFLVAILWRCWIPVRLLSILLAIFVLAGPASSSQADLILFDVGQGDALLLRDGRHTALIDGGGWPRADIAARVLIPVLAAQGVRSIDKVVITHSDIDHCGGAVDLATYLPVGTVVSSEHARGAACMERLAELPGIEQLLVSQGASWRVGRWHIETLHPSNSSTGRGNNASLVLLVTGFGRAILLTGDIEEQAERHILARHSLNSLSADVLKVAHHGSRTSTSMPFLRAVSPQLALISAGRRNRYGHPSAVVTERLEKADASILRTDRDGMVRLVFNDNGSMRVERFGPLLGDALH